MGSLLTDPLTTFYTLAACSCKVSRFTFISIQYAYDCRLAVEKKWPNDRDRLTRMSLIQEGFPQNIRRVAMHPWPSYKLILQ